MVLGRTLFPCQRTLVMLGFTCFYNLNLNVSIRSKTLREDPGKSKISPKKRGLRSVLIKIKKTIIPYLHQCKDDRRPRDI